MIGQVERIVRCPYLLTLALPSTLTASKKSLCLSAPPLAASAFLAAFLTASLTLSPPASKPTCVCKGAEQND